METLIGLDALPSLRFPVFAIETVALGLLRRAWSAICFPIILVSLRGLRRCLFLRGSLLVSKFCVALLSDDYRSFHLRRRRRGGPEVVIAGFLECKGCLRSLYNWLGGWRKHRREVMSWLQY